MEVLNLRRARVKSSHRNNATLFSLVLFIALTTMSVILTACKDDLPQKPYNPLEATMWKFLGFYDVETDILKEVGVLDNDFILLKFVKDTIIHANMLYYEFLF